MAKKVTIYSTPTCVFCHAAKNYFDEHGVKYQEHNVATDLAMRREMVEKSGQMGVPVIIIGSEIIIGFNKPKITQLLGL